VVLTVAALAVVAWLVGTTGGAVRLLGAISSHSQIKIEVSSVKGRLLDHLSLKGVRVQMPNKEIMLDSLALDWKPLLLLGGTLGVRELSLENLRIQDNSPPGKKEPIRLTWPRTPRLAELLDARINRLQITRLSYRLRDQKPLLVDSVSGSAVWQEQVLSINDLKLTSPSGKVAGTIAAGLQRPSLKLDLVLSPAQPMASYKQLSIQTRLLPGASPEQLAGAIAIAATGETADKPLRLNLTGIAGMTATGINLRKVRLEKAGQRGHLLADGAIDLAGKEPLLRMQLNIVNLDLGPDLKLPSDISGNLRLTGTTEKYRGNFNLVNRGKAWRTAQLASDFQGDRSGLRLSPLSGTLLGGSVQGQVDVGWSQGLAIVADLKGRKLDPARIAPAWQGVANFDLKADLASSRQKPLHGRLNLTLLESRLHGQPLTGGVQAAYEDKDLIISKLALQGKGFNLKAAGRLDQRLDLTVRVSDLSGLVPVASGELQAAGWMRRQQARMEGSITARARNLTVQGISIASGNLSARLGNGQDYPLHLAADLHQAVYKQFQADAVALEADGTLSSHTLKANVSSTGADARLTLSGSYRAGAWQGDLKQFSGRDSVGPWKLAAPARLVAGKKGISLSSLIIKGVQPEQIEISADLGRDPLKGDLKAGWNGLNLARANPWLSKMQLKGSSNGNLSLKILPDKRVIVAGKAGAQGSVTTEGKSITIKKSAISLEGGQQGLNAAIDLQLVEGALLKAKLSSSAPARLALPEQGKLELDLQGVDLGLVKPWLPKEMQVTGSLNATANGKFLPGQRLEMEGQAALSQASLQMQRPEGEMKVDLRNAKLSWGWRGETLSGSANLTLAEYGQAQGAFTVPLPARFPIAVNQKGPIQAAISGQLREKGILSAFLPALVQESHADLDLDLKVRGKWEGPVMEGKLQLSRAGAYLPSAGIHLKDVRLAAYLEKDQVRIDSFRAVSGPGYIEGNALILLKGRQLASYRASLTGKQFQTVHFPELEVQSSPQLTLEGTPQQVSVKGEVRLPELLITGPPTRAAIAPSKDVIVVDRSQPVVKEKPLALDLQVRIVLGERVLVKLEGVDAQLAGSIDLAARSINHVTSKGEIKVTKGRYQTYGVKLDITRGRLFYAGGPINQPTLDILALRSVGDVKAGVTVTGSLQQPLIKLYSEPTMPDVDILAYVVLGHPLGSSSGEQQSLMTKAAGALLSTGQSAVLQDQIKSRLGLSTLEIQTTGKEAPGRGGYKEIPVSPTGTQKGTQPSSISQTMLTVGKYLTPQLYVSYGRSLFTGNNLFLLRYDIFRHWQIETQTGTESGADIYYKIEFN
jgi:translocation and assembly module TamB